MKAIVQDRYGPADVLELRDVDEPVARKGEVVVRVHAAGVDAGVWHVMEGEPYVVRLGYGLRRPRVPARGIDLAGVVETVGPDVTSVAPGDEVYGVGDGTFAELARAKADRLAPKPSTLSFVEAAAVPMAGVAALKALRDLAQVRPGQHVLVIGAGGGVGTFAVQIARALGAHVTGVCSTSKVDLVRSLGADDVVDYTTSDVEASDRRYDVVLEVAGDRSLRDLRRLLTPKGTAVLVGGEGGRWLGPLRKLAGAAVLSPFVGQSIKGLISIEKTADLEHLARMVDAGDVAPVVDRVYPLADAAQAVAAVRRGDVRGKVVVSVLDA